MLSALRERLLLFRLCSASKLDPEDHPATMLGKQLLVRGSPPVDVIAERDDRCLVPFAPELLVDDRSWRGRPGGSGMLIAKVLSLDDPDVTLALTVVIGFVPALVTFVVELTR